MPMGPVVLGGHIFNVSRFSWGLIENGYVQPESATTNVALAPLKRVSRRNLIRIHEVQRLRIMQGS